MARVQEHEFIDLSKPADRPVDEKTRRSFLTAVSALAGITAMAPQAFARQFLDKYASQNPLARYPNRRRHSTRYPRPEARSRKHEAGRRKHEAGSAQQEAP